MRGAFVSRAMSAALVVAALAMGACDDNPLEFDPQDTETLSLNPTFMVVPAGRTAELNVRALNAGNEPNFAEVSAEENACGGPASVTLADNPAATPVEPPGRFLVTAGNTIGASCVIVSAGGVTDTVDVFVVADAIEITSDHTAPLRAGEGGTVTVQIIASDGSVVTPFDVADATFSSSADSVVSVAADGSFTTGFAGTAVITASWSGTDATGTTGLGVTRTATATITVIPNIPDAAVLADFGTLIVGSSAELEVIVSDAEGNQNTNADEILGITASSSDPLVASVVFERREIVDPLTNEVTGAQVFVTVTAEAPGNATISGFVQVSTGPDIPFGPADVEVLALGLTPSSGPPATNVVIGGAGFLVDGATTNVTVDGLNLGNFTVVSASQIQAQMPLFQTAGDYEVAITIDDIPLTTFSWTQTVDFDEAATEDNDFAIGGTPITAAVPIVASGAFTAEPIDPSVFGAGNDYYLVTLSAASQIHVLFEWIGGPDNDLYVVDGAFTAFQCGFAGATANVPEEFDCSLAAGDYFIIADNFDLADATYDLTVTIP